MGKILGLSGRLRSGKGMIVNFLKRQLEHKITTIDFSLTIKILAQDCLGAEPQQMKRLNLHLGNFLPGGKTIAEAMQHIRRSFLELDPECWTRCWQNNIERCNKWRNPPQLILVTDVRLPSEIEAIHKCGGHVIRLLRNEIDPNYENTEDLTMDKAQDVFDWVFDNSNLNIAEQNQTLWSEIIKRGWI